MLKALKIIFVMAFLGLSFPGKAITFNLDSIAAMGRFPKFCVKVYREGDRIFNSIDTSYVKSPGYPFKISTSAHSWVSYYSFEFNNRTKIDFISIPSTTVGVHLSWLAVSIGYEKNVSNLIGLKTQGNSQWTFGFNSSRVVADFYYVTGDGGLKLNFFDGDEKERDPDVYFDGCKTEQWQFQVYYFFNHLRYSHSASFSFGKIQEKTAGSWFAGITALGQAYNFDFNSLPDKYKSSLPLQSTAYRYRTNSHLWGLTGGYAANINLGRGWIMGVTENPTLGVRYGYSSNGQRRVRFGFSNTISGSFIYNHPRNRLYLGAIGYFYGNILTDDVHALTNLFLSFKVAAGYRF